MPVLSIGDKQVTVGDDFLKLSPDQQNATVQEIASQIGVAAAAAPAAPAAPVTANNVARAAATGVPIIGGALNKLDATTNAALAPLLNRFFDERDQLPQATFGERYAHSLADQEGADKRFAEEHPIVDTAAQLAGGAAAMAPVIKAAPVAFGVAGKLPQMVRNGAASGAALSAADAAVRGENPITAAETGGIIGAAAGPVGKAVGKVVSSIADRVRPPPTVPQNIERVAGVDIPMSTPQMTQNAADSAEAQILARGGRGVPAQEHAQAFNDLQGARVNEARDTIAAGLDASGTSARVAPQDAAERIAAELIAQEQARQAAEAGVHSGPMSPAQQADDLARAFGGGRPAPSAVDAGEALSDRLAAARDAAKADYKGKYDLVGEQPGAFAPGSAAGFRNDVVNGLSRDVPLDDVNTPKSLAALRVIDHNLNDVGPARPVAATAAGGADHGAQRAQDVADIRARFGDAVAAAYDRQKQTATAPQAQSLLQFIASKGGLGPDAELEAIGAHGHTVNVDGVGRRKLVRQGGWPLDYAREAAEEAGYLHGDHNGTSTVNDLLDAVDAEMRGQKRYPQGFEGTETKREATARGEREQYEHDRRMQGFDDDLAAAGHGELGPDVKDRAIKLMANERMDADTAVEHALHQLEQEDGAAHAAGFPGDRAPVPEASGSGFTMGDVERVRKALSKLYGDARRSMMAGGSGTDLYALEHITDQFDARVRQMIADGKFSGDGPAVLKMQEDARAAFADYKQKFAKRGSGDTIGAAVEKILGRFSDTKATPDEVVKLAYGAPASPGGQMPVQIAQRIAKIFGRDSVEFGTYKQGLFAQLTAGEPEKAAARIEEFLTGTKGKLLAQTVFDAGERSQLAQYARRLRFSLPAEPETGPAAAAIRKIVEGNASPNDLANALFGPTGKGAGSRAVPLAQKLKATLSPEGWNAVRQGMFEKLTRAGEGKIEFEAQALSQRMHEFLNESGSQLAKVLYSPQELDLMRKLASVYKQMIPVKGTTNPSGSAPMLAKMATGLRGSLAPLLGFSHGGLPGAALGVLAEKGMGALRDQNAARAAVELFYGPQAKRLADPRFAHGAGLLGLISSQEERRLQRR